jgi:hypothetical protein
MAFFPFAKSIRTFFLLSLAGRRSTSCWFPQKLFLNYLFIFLLSARNHYSHNLYIKAPLFNDILFNLRVVVIAF